jgi:glycosyltransferase involved in cell wall biosynthesis
MIVWFATKGSGTNEALRMQTLLSDLPNVAEWPFQKTNKRASFREVVRRLRKERPVLVVMEGTGMAGGLACLLGKFCWGISYIVSSGDAVGPFIAAHFPWAGVFAAIYERMLCRFAAGFIGWTPYLAGRALTLGCPRAVTAPGWVIGSDNEGTAAEWRREYRKRWQISEDALVVGLVGSLDWNDHRQYCYGMELVIAATRLRRDDLVVVIVGKGSGHQRLREAAGELLGTTVRFPGAVELHDVVPSMAAFDVASLPQSTDGVGVFRYTTKLSEYVAAKLPVITSRIPAAYDLGIDWVWRLPGRGPWEETYINALARLMEELDASKIAERRKAIPRQLDAFNRDVQITRVTAFIHDILEELA